MHHSFLDRDTLDAIYGNCPDAIMVERFDTPIPDTPAERVQNRVGIANVIYTNAAFRIALRERGFSAETEGDSAGLIALFTELFDDRFREQWHGRVRQSINNMQLGAYTESNQSASTNAAIAPLMVSTTPIIHSGFVHGCWTRITDATPLLGHDASERRALKQIDAFVRTENVPLLCLAFQNALPEKVTAGELGQAYFGATITHITDSAAALFEDTPEGMLQHSITTLKNPGIERLIKNAFPVAAVDELLNIGDTPELTVEVNSAQPMVYRVKPTFVFDAGMAVEVWLRIEDVTSAELQAREQRAMEQTRAMALTAASLHQFEADQVNGVVTLDKEVMISLGISKLPDTLQGWRDILTVDNVNLSGDELANIFAGNIRDLNFIARLTNDDGEDRYLEVWGVVNADNGSNNPGRTIGLYRDVTQNEQLRARLREKKTLEGLGVLAGGVAHDFNNLLMSVLGYAELMEADVLDAPSRDPAVLQQSALGNIEEIRNAALRASELCASLLAYAGQHMIEKKSLDLTSLVRSNTELVGLALGQQVPIVRDLDNEVLIAADKGQLTQVIVNLVGNAADAMEGYDGVVYLSVTTEVFSPAEQALLPEHIDTPTARFACLRVRDQGCGMSAETLERIYEPFFTTKADGRGLGMAAVHGIVKHHGGVIFVKSAPGEGTEFRVCLPLLAQAPVVESANIVAPARVAQPRVLVVDDEPGVRTIAAEMLRHLNCVVHEAETAEMALQLFAEHTFDYALLDITMPVMSGTELAELLLERVPDLQVVLCSGYTDKDVPAALLKRCAFIHKPFTLGEVSATLQLEGTNKESAIGA